MTVSIHDELIAAFAAWSPSLARDVARDTPLLTSGRLDSVALFQLLLWIEGKIGRPIDVTAIDMPATWNTVDMVVAFVEREKRA
jgi:acyl carrier protein